jgi:hypothetical protein
VLIDRRQHHSFNRRVKAAAPNQRASGATLCSKSPQAKASLRRKSRATRDRVARVDLHARSVKTMMGPIPITEGAAAGQAIVYFNAPLALQLEAKGMAYEKDASTPPRQQGHDAGPGIRLVFLGSPPFHCENPTF